MYAVLRKALSGVASREATNSYFAVFAGGATAWERLKIRLVSRTPTFTMGALPRGQFCNTGCGRRQTPASHGASLQ